MILGVDLGTGSMKGLLFGKNKEVLSTYSVSYNTYHGQKGFSEQDPQDWINAFKSIMDYFIEEYKSFREELEAISFSGQMHSLILLDNEGEVLRPSILWNDVRNSEQSHRLLHNKDLLLSSTYNLPLEGFTLPKILWVQDNEPKIWEKVAHLLLPKDYLRYYLGGKFQTDYSDAAGTLLLNLNTMDWDSHILNKYSIEENIMPEICNSDEDCGVLIDSLKEQWRLLKDVKLFTGAADNACSAIGAGISSDNVGMLSIGTSGVILSNSELSDEYNGKLHIFAHALRDSYYKMGVTLSAGSSLDWIKNLLYKNISYNEMFKEIEESSIGSDGLLFTPYLSGERSPHSDGKIRGSIIGIDINHNRADIARSVVEGITFSLYDCYITMHQKFDKIISVGGGAKSKQWLQIQANIFNTEIITLENEEGPALGAALIAAKGLGWFDTLEEAMNLSIKYNEIIRPNPDYVNKYKKIFYEYTKIYLATKEITHNLNDIS